MAETNTPEEPALPAKRKSDLTPEDAIAYPKKNPKLEASLKDNNQNPELSDHNSSEAGVKSGKDGIFTAAAAASDAGPKEEDENGDEEGEEDDVDGEESNGKAEADRKGKGVMRDEKGKGKLIAEEEEEEDEDDDEDSDDDSSDGGSEFEDGDSDLSDDPLAEVDLDNILPSRTRRKQVQSGVYISSDVVGNDNGEDDSDDSDA
ncbi:uncharacterized protein LOC107427966 [Ziziphus jujuba]|uniref:Uncharacterized protein LOC107427966 n=1 Tax=Ziziphus jujuba TaxID=326968 RepID=A0A6P4B5T2_ZIZJJ|nr:uncharacterized protein LOC107427966 [Ziziphus jujuba]XP_048337524.2 uncharacterized protein LOC107427966 [Ziziphus jujuba]